MKDIDQRREELEKVLAEYTDKVGIPNTNPNTDLAKSYLALSRDELNALSYRECYERAFILNQHGLFIQAQLNKENARYKWAEAQLGKMAIATQSNQQKWTQFEEKKLKVALNDQAASRLNDIRNYSQLRIASLDFVATSVKNMADTLKEIGRSKIPNKH